MLEEKQSSNRGTVVLVTDGSPVKSDEVCGGWQRWGSYGTCTSTHACAKRQSAGQSGYELCQTGAIEGKDGQSARDCMCALHIAETTKQALYEVFVVAVGSKSSSEYFVEIMQTMASSPPSEHYFDATSFSEAAALWIWRCHTCVDRRKQTCARHVPCTVGELLSRLFYLRTSMYIPMSICTSIHACP